MELVFSFEHLEKVIKYVVIPLLIVLLIFWIFQFIYKIRQRKDMDSEKNYVINYWSQVISIIFCAVVLGVVNGFSIAYIQEVRNYGLIEQNQFFYYFLMFFPIVPFVFLIVLIRRFLKNIKEYKEEKGSYNEEEDRL